MSELEASIRDLIARYVASLIDVDEFSDRLPDGWELDEANDSAATDVAMLAVGYLAGYQAGDRTEQELRALLAPEASWQLKGTFTAVVRSVRVGRPETRLHVDAGTPPPAALVS